MHTRFYVLEALIFVNVYLNKRLDDPQQCKQFFDLATHMYEIEGE